MPVDKDHIAYAWYPSNKNQFKREFIRLGRAKVFYKLENGTFMQADDWQHKGENGLSESSDLDLNFKAGLANRNRAPKGATGVMVFAAEKLDNNT